MKPIESKLLLTSFGFSSKSPKDLAFDSYFYRMPAVSMDLFGPSFQPDYPVFFLFDKFVIDAESLHRISLKESFRDFLLVVRALDNEGLLEVVEFDNIIAPYKNLIEESVEYDLRNIEMWFDSFDKLSYIWQNFASRARGFLNEKVRQTNLSDEEKTLERIFHEWIMGMLPGDDKTTMTLRLWKRKLPQEDRDAARQVVREYLTHVTSNLCLTDNLDAAIHDWADIMPLYNQKMKMTLRTDADNQNSQYQIRQLIRIMFPNFLSVDASRFAKLLTDRRVRELRDLVKESVARNIIFDENFANRILREVLKIESNAKSAREIIGWLTTPLGFIPWVGTPLQLAGQKLSEHIVEKRLKKGKEWFFLISNVGDKW